MMAATPTKIHKLKASAPPPDPIDELAELHTQAARIEGIRRDIALIVASISAIRTAQIQPLEDRLAALRESVDSGLGWIKQTLIKQPKDHQKLLRGNMTYFLQPGREAVEVLDEAKALAEVKALGPAGLACVKVEEKLVKAALKGLLENPEAPALEHVRLMRGEPVLVEKEA